MKLTERVWKALNSQINEEFHSAYLYLAMSCWCEENGWPGCAHWLTTQAKEEIGHAMKFLRYIQSRNNPVKLTEIKTPAVNWKSVQEIFDTVLEAERKTTGLICAITKIIAEEEDYTSQSLIQWFLDEQVEEEQNAEKIVQELSIIGEHTSALFMFDRELGRRTDS